LTTETTVEESFIRRLTEVDLLASLAGELGVKLRLRGSVAKNLLKARKPLVDSENHITASLFDFVPPLADIDLFIDKPDFIPALRGLISRHIPLSGFFRWEFSSQVEFNWFSDRANLRILDEPEFHLHPEEPTKWDRLLRELKPRVERLMRKGFDAEWAMRDLFYIAYQHPVLLRSPAVTTRLPQP
jgi:hypothetical protein